MVIANSIPPKKGQNNKAPKKTQNHQGEQTTIRAALHAVMAICLQMVIANSISEGSTEYVMAYCVSGSINCLVSPSAAADISSG